MTLLNMLSYILLAVGIIFCVIGTKKDKKNLRYAGVILIVVLFALGLPAFVKGFIDGITQPLLVMF